MHEAKPHERLQDEQDFVTKSYPVDPVHPVRRNGIFFLNLGKNISPIPNVYFTYTI